MVCEMPFGDQDARPPNVWTMTLRIGVVILPDLSWPDFRDRCREAEERGFQTAWTYDHLSWRTLRDGPWLGAVPLLTAAAATTTTIRLGTLVTSPNFRHPALLAKDVMTLDQISGGRLDLGIGAGGPGWDATALGNPAPTPRERTERFEDFIRALDVMLREPKGSLRRARITRRRTTARCPAASNSRGCRSRSRPPVHARWTVAAAYGSCWVTFGPGIGDGSAEAWFAKVEAAGRPARRGLHRQRARPAATSAGWRWSRSKPAWADGTESTLAATSRAASPNSASPTPSSIGHVPATQRCPAATRPSSTRSA